MGDISTAKSNVVRLDATDEIKEGWADELNFPARLKEEVFIKRLDGPLFFGYTNEFTLLASEIPETASHTIIRMGRVPYIDQLGLYALEEVLLKLKNSGIEPLLVGLNEQPRYLMGKIDIIPDLVPEEHLFKNFKDAMVFVRTHVPDEV